MTGTTDEAFDSIAGYFDPIDERVEQLCDSVLKPRLDALEGERRKVRGYVARAIVIVVIPVLLFFLSDTIEAYLRPFAEGTPMLGTILDWWPAIAIGLIVLAIVFVVGSIAMPGMAAQLNYRRRFKQEVVAEIFRAVSPQGTYQPDHHLSKQVVDEAGFFSGKYQTFNGDDLIRGRAGEIEFEASEIRASGNVTLKSGRRRSNEIVSVRPNLTDFGGTFYHFGVGRTFRGHTIVEPETIEGRFPRHRRDYQQVTIDDSAFTEAFRVYSTDPGEATEILTPTMRRKLLGLGEYLPNPPLVAFVRNKVFVAVHQGRSLFEPTIAKPAGYALVSTIAEFFATPPMLVKELGLDDIGGSRFASAPAASILAQPAAQTFKGLDVPGGVPITPENIMTMAMPEADERDAALPTPPASRVQITPMASEGFEVSYGLHPGYYVRILWALALAPFAIGGLARLAGESGASTLDAIAAQVPIVTQVADLATQYPIPFVAIVALFWALPTWSMLHVPRGLRVDREGVHVKKRVWPIGKHHPIDRIASVTVNEKQVMLTRKNTSIWRRFVTPAPPMRSKEDARWLAAQVRRALVMYGGLRS